MRINRISCGTSRRSRASVRPPFLVGGETGRLSSAMMPRVMVMLPPEGQVLAGKYRVERTLGRGGMGVVVAAWHLELDQRVAIKFLHPELAERPEAAERFRREARAAAKIKSEHVVRVL